MVEDIGSVVHSQSRNRHDVRIDGTGTQMDKAVASSILPPVRANTHETSPHLHASCASPSFCTSLYLLASCTSQHLSACLFLLQSGSKVEPGDNEAESVAPTGTIP